MFGSIGMSEMIVIFLIALIVFGPRRLPELGKSLGRAIAEFRKATTDLQRQLEHEVEAAETAAKRPDVPPAEARDERAS
jgi:sec-independent protein translocase protein TatA